jgi:prepilin-type processing-associated H-X9-DG protein
MGNRGIGSALAYWPHTAPWGANVGFSDGHAEWVAIPDKSLAVLPQSFATLSQSDHYVYQMFKCFDKKAFDDANTITAANGW